MPTQLEIAALHASLARSARRTAAFAALALVAAAQSSDSGSQTPPNSLSRPGGPPPTSPNALPQTSTREQMWFAPTVEDWKKPCLITWQRKWDDAVAVARESAKPILICVNMDGEIASEHYAGVRYRQADIAKLYEPYVCVIASVYRHSPRDYDDQGQRIPCPRFGSVTCGEHIAIEPILYEKYMDGRRIAPRHIMVELEKGGAEAFDVFYAWDTASVFKTVTDGVKDRPPGHEIVRSDRPVIERVSSYDIRDRDAVESAYVRGDAVVRRRLLEEALKFKEVEPIELLRLALFGFDLELARLARKALAESDSEGAIELIADALRIPMEAGERDALVAALDRLGAQYPRAKTLAAVYRGLSGKSTALDIEGWSRGLESAQPKTVDVYTLESKLEERARNAHTNTADPAIQVDLAEAYLALAASPDTPRKYGRLMFQDARKAALEAERLGLKGWRVDAVVAVASSQLGEWDEARKRAEVAVGGMPADVTSWSSMAVLELFADSRQRSIWRAMREKREWSPQWLSDIHASYAILARHPLGTDMHVVAHYDFLRSLGANAQAARVLDEGFVRFSDSWTLHDRLRGRALAEKGVDGLEATYDALLASPNAATNLRWFAGYASIVAAEFHRRGGAPDRALACYEHAVAHYDANIAVNPESRDSADHYAAIALAGRGRILFERGDYEGATNAILASFARRADSAASLDGLNLSPADTAKQLRVKLGEEKLDALAQKLQAAMDALDPELLKLPAYEREGPSNTSGDARPPRRGGR